MSHEQASHVETIGAIEKGVEFKGINVWTLIFAIFIASIGLNVNSTAVIIGAMLISPLMGPIMGLGLSVGIYDFNLLKKSFKNLIIAVLISVITSTLYFLISPLSEAQSELLSRTTPTIYDVLIALFGGLAGIVAGATREKGNAIPGVAIATALMPPLCTAGFGIATGNLLYFVGAFYLFFINAVMISFSTFLMVRFLKFPLRQEVDKVQSQRVKRYILIIVAITVLPSIYFAYNIVKQAIFKTNAMNFVSHEFNYDHTQIINTTFSYNPQDSSVINILLTGKHIDAEAIRALKSKLEKYAIYKTKLVIRQGLEATRVDMNQLRSGVIEDLYQKSEVALKDKDARIQWLENKLETLYSEQYPVKDLATEINAINNSIYAFSVSPNISYNVDKNNYDTVVVVNLKTTKPLTDKDKDVISKWLEKRLKNDRLKVIIEK
jgi:uncharacterized hydrophobic protein (TIGR00271 family)